MLLKPGDRLRGNSSSAEVVIIRAPHDDVVLNCAGRPMVDMADLPAEVPPSGPGDGEFLLVGKKYQDDALGLEVLCTKAGRGPLVVQDRELTVKAAAALPSSD